MERRTFSGVVVATVLANTLSNTSTTGDSIDLLDGSSFPSPTSLKPSVVVINRGTVDEEKILISLRSSNTLTILERGYDGTSIVTHNSNSVVDHVLDATVAQGMNDTIYDREILGWMGI